MKIDVWRYLWGWFTDFYNFMGGVFMTALGYFLPIKDMVYFITILFIVDVVFGYWKAHRFTKAKFQPKIVWEKTVPRWLISVVIIAVLFSWDKVHHQDYVSTYYAGGYFLSGMVIVSILENAILITNWKVFRKLREIIVNNVEKNTGIDIDEEKETNNE